MRRLLLSLPIIFIMAASTIAHAQDYKLDPVHSFVVFRIHHAHAGYVYGRFNGPQGTFKLDADHPANSVFDVTVQAGNVDTANEQRDAHLRSDDFFDASNYATITFKSTSVEKIGDNQLKLTGNLTLLGQTRTITTEATTSGPATDHQGVVRFGVETTFTIKRSDFGMDKMLEGVGDEVRLIVSLEGMQQ